MSPELRGLLVSAAASPRFALVASLAAASEALHLREELSLSGGELAEEIPSTAGITGRWVAPDRVASLREVGDQALEVARDGLRFAGRCLELFESMGLDATTRPEIERLAAALEAIGERLPPAPGTDR